MDASAVAEYLKKNPAFFEDYADVVAQIFVPHPHGGHAIPIAERQMLALRDKVYDLEQKLHELIAHGAENDLIGICIVIAHQSEELQIETVANEQRIELVETNRCRPEECVLELDVVGDLCL